jgi:hypothetical protein
MDEQPQNVLAVYPLVRHAQAGPAPDGQALLVEAVTADGAPVRFAIPLPDVQDFVAFLLISVGGIGVMRDDQACASDVPAAQSRPVPATSIAIGEPRGDEGYLGVAVGQAELVFSVPLAAFDELGRALLTISAGTDGRYNG